MKILDIPQRGARGNVVASRNRSGQYLKQRIAPAQPGTAAQQGAWDNMTDLSELWNRLEDKRRAAWRMFAEDVFSRPNLLQRGSLSGCQLFKKLNRVLDTCRREWLLDPPSVPEFAPHPVEGFEIRAAGGRPALKLRVSQKALWEARSPLEDLMVYGWTPCNAGAETNDLYAFLGLLRPPVRWECVITAMYLAKLEEWRQLEPRRYHVPLEGSRVFIRVFQQVNGWKNEVGMFQANALVPPNGLGRLPERLLDRRNRPLRRSRQ